MTDTKNQVREEVKNPHALVVTGTKALKLVESTDKALTFYDELDKKEGMNHANFMGV